MSLSELIQQEQPPGEKTEVKLLVSAKTVGVATLQVHSGLCSQWHRAEDGWSPVKGRIKAIRRTFDGYYMAACTECHRGVEHRLAQRVLDRLFERTQAYDRNFTSDIKTGQNIHLALELEQANWVGWENWVKWCCKQTVDQLREEGRRRCRETNRETGWETDEDEAEELCVQAELSSYDGSSIWCGTHVYSGPNNMFINGVIPKGQLDSWRYQKNSVICDVPSHLTKAQIKLVVELYETLGGQKTNELETNQQILQEALETALLCTDLTRG